MFFEIGIRSDSPYAYRIIDPECNLTMAQIALNTRRRFSSVTEIDERISAIREASPDLITPEEEQIDIIRFQEVYIPENLRPDTCQTCSVQGLCPMIEDNPNSDLRALYPPYLHNPEVVISVLFEKGAIIPKVVLPRLCRATPEGIYSAGMLIDEDGEEFEDEESRFSQKIFMADVMDPETQENWVIEERYRASNAQFVLAEPLLACVGCSLDCPLKNQDGFEFV